jgi:hypothetical protein
MTDTNNWNKRLKTADNAFVSDLLHNTGLTGGPSLKDLPWAGLAALAVGGVGSKIKEMKENRQEKGVDDNKNVNNFSNDMSKMRDIVDQRKTDKPVRNHPSVPGFQPDTRPGVFDYQSNGYSGGPPPSFISDISEHPRFNSGDQGKSQKGRPFDRDEE